MNPRILRFTWQFPILFLIMIWLTACSATSTPTVLSPLSTATPTPIPTLKTTQPTPDQTVSTPSPCTATQGALVNTELPTKMLKYPLTVKVYLPPCYDKTKNQGYPVLYMLHGMADTNEQWVNLGMTDTADRLITAKTIQPMLIVMPYEINWQLSPDQSGYEAAITDLLIPWVEKTYHVCTARSCRAIGGLSRGGNWAVKIGFDHWQLFTAIGAHSTPLFIGGVLNLVSAVRTLPSITDAPALYVDAGLKDENLAQVTEFEKTLKDFHIAHEYHLNLGAHDAVYWSAHVEEYLLWYAGQLKK